MKNKVIVICFDCKSVNGLTSLSQAVENMDSHEFNRCGKHNLATYAVEDLMKFYVVFPVAKFPVTNGRLSKVPMDYKPFMITCKSCKQREMSNKHQFWADKEGEAFKDYFCSRCKEKEEKNNG